MLISNFIYLMILVLSAEWTAAQMSLQGTSSAGRRLFHSPMISKMDSRAEIVIPTLMKNDSMTDELELGIAYTTRISGKHGGERIQKSPEHIRPLVKLL